MNIKTRLSLQFTFLVAGILVFFSILIYYFSYTNQLAKFRENLLIRAENTATLLVNVAEVDSVLLKKIHQSTISWKNEEIAIIDSALKVIWSDNLHYLTSDVIRSSSGNDDLSYFKIKEKDGIRCKHRFKNQEYNVFVMAFDSNRAENLAELREIFFWSIIFSILFSVLLSYLFSQLAIRPISQIIRRIKAINPTQLNYRLDVRNIHDEIGQLAISFNEMLANIEQAFTNQDEFVSNASHELRTPLAVMIAESDYLLSRARSPQEYIEHISNTILDLKRINSLLYSLLELAQLKHSTSIELTDVRMDEAFYTAVQQIKTVHRDRRFVVKIHYPDDENDLLAAANPRLLDIAFKNLLDNACKFSEDEILTEMSVGDGKITIDISDRGIGIPPDEVDNIFNPFNRATNVRLKAGFGIGLAMVFKIIKLHGAEIKVHSVQHKGTQFVLVFHKAKKD